MYNVLKVLLFSFIRTLSFFVHEFLKECRQKDGEMSGKLPKNKSSFYASAVQYRHFPLQYVLTSSLSLGEVETSLSPSFID